MKLHDIFEQRESRRVQVRDMLMSRNKKARNAKNPEMPELDGGTSKATNGVPNAPNTQTMVSDLVPHTL